MNANAHEIVSHDEWLAARTALLADEKELTRLRDAVSRRRRELPWERVEKEYVFTTPRGRKTLADLFDGRSQLVVYHFMFDPDDETGCKHCSFWADSFDPNVVHLAARDVSFVVVSRAPVEKLERYRRAWAGRSRGCPRTGATSTTTSAPRSATTSSTSPCSTSARSHRAAPTARASRSSPRATDGAIYRTYSTHGRGIDILNATYNYLDLVPLGRGEEGKPNQYWVRRHDEYGT